MRCSCTFNFWGFLFMVFLFIGCNEEDIDYNETNLTVEQDDHFVSPVRAKNISEHLLYKNFKTKQFSKKLISKITPVLDQDGTNLYYIINYDRGGFLIIAADDRSIPILAYSEENSFDTSADYTNASEGLSDWVAFAKEQILEIKKRNLSSSKEIESLWEEYEVNKGSKLGLSPSLNKMNEPPIGGCTGGMYEVSPLLETQWDQGCGYNSLLPSSSCTNQCGRVLAGCVPVAIAQVMNYYEHPNNYNWGNMLNGDTPTNETALLIRDIHNGISTINYSCGATGVPADYNVANLLKNSFGYSAAYQVKTNNYAETIKTNVSQNRPVILSGSGTSGHMWVCDGIRNLKTCLSGGGAVSTLTLHMNWGWGGRFNGWYSFQNFNPGTALYNNNNRLVYNIRP